MQQIALPSLYNDTRRRKVLTQPFPLVRPSRTKEDAPAPPRKFIAGLLFGVLMSLVLVLFGYEARIYANTHPNLFGPALAALEKLGR